MQSFYDTLLQLLPERLRERARSQSIAEILASMEEDNQISFFRSLSNGQIASLKWSWDYWARPNQMAPSGSWSTYLRRAGRGEGKTRSGVEWFQGRMMEEARWGALVARTPADARDYLIEGKAGFLRVTRPDQRPIYEPSKRRMSWPNGSWATIYSDEEPDQLRGFSGDTALLDEFAKWKHPKLCWDNLAFGMREASSDRPRRMITTTPRPLAVLKEIEALPGTIVAEGKSYDNRSNLDPTWFAETIVPYEGTRLGKQEIEGLYVEDIVGTLFTMEALDRARVSPAEVTAKYTTTVVSIDPSGSKDEDKDADEKKPKNDEIGIIVASLGDDMKVYLREDLSLTGGPETWAAAAIAAFYRYAADHIIAETNFGGDMVAFAIRAIDPNVPVRVVTASRAKHIRAEPVSALYDVRRDAIRHVGQFPLLEEQLTKFTTLGYQGPRSPDRADSWIWAVTDLALGSGAIGWLEYMRRLAEASVDQPKPVDALLPAQAAAAVAPNPGPPDFGWGFGAVKPVISSKVKIIAPAGSSHVYGRSGACYMPDRNQVIEVSAEDAEVFLKTYQWQQAA